MNKRIYNKTTGRYYVGFDCRSSQPIWSAPHKPFQGVIVNDDRASSIVRQLTAVEPALDLIVVSAFAKP